MSLIIASCATIAEREDALREMVASIAPQVDALHLYLNDRVAYYAGFPDNVHQWKASCCNGDLNDAAKFYIPSIFEDSCYFLTLDDDLIYPAAYVERMIYGIERYERRAVCSFHGRTFGSFPISSYYGHRPRMNYRCLGAVTKDAAVHVAGTGVMGWHSSTVQFSMEDFPSPNMADVHAAVKLQTEGVPCVVLAHKEGWIRHSDKITMSKTIAYRFRHEHSEQTRRINALGSLHTFENKLEG